MAFRPGKSTPLSAKSSSPVNEVSEVTPTVPLSKRYPPPIPGVIPFGALVIFAGASGVGKTVMLSEMLVRLREGRTIWGHPTNCPADFFYLAGDRPWDPTFTDTFEVAGFPDIKHYALADDTPEDPSTWRKEDALKILARLLEKKLQPTAGSLVIVDPAYPLFIKGNQNDARDVAVSMHGFRRLVQRFQITLICCANTAKEREENKTQRPQDRVSGSGAFIAYSDTNMYMHDNGNEGGTVFGWTPRRAAHECFQVQFDPHTRLFVPYTGQLAPDDPITATDPLHPKTQQVLDLVPVEGMIETAELIDAAEGLGLNEPTTRYHLRKLKDRQLVVHIYSKVGRQKPS